MIENPDHDQHDYDKLLLRINNEVPMELTIIVPDKTRSALEQRARERGCSDVNKYVEGLITTDLLAAKSFDEILAPIRETFQATGMSEDQLEALFEEAREEVYQERGLGNNERR